METDDSTPRWDSLDIPSGGGQEIPAHLAKKASQADAARGWIELEEEIDRRDRKRRLVVWVVVISFIALWSGFIAFVIGTSNRRGAHRGR
jgi:hypothetical protein